MILSDKPVIRIGSRESALACVQAKLVADALRQQWPDYTICLKTFKTKGDLILDKALSKIGDKGLFTKELEQALLADQIDIAVHSMKDMPGLLAPEFKLSSVLTREDPADIMLTRQSSITLDTLPEGSVIGTSSLRREAQLRRLRPDLQYRLIRGNLQTRYEKLINGTYDAIMLAAAGIYRLSWHDRFAFRLNPLTECIPAACQGILGVEYLAKNQAIEALLSPLTDTRTEIAQQAERAFLRELEGGCQLPVGAYCFYQPDDEIASYTLTGTILSPDGLQQVTQQVTVDMEEPGKAGRFLANTLLKQGGKAILDTLRLV
jgi:hydroxymethylbilane synthase